MPIAGEMRARITLQRLNEQTDLWDEVAIVWAAAEPQGDAGCRFRIWFREDLQTKADIEPAMRVIYRGAEYDLVDVVEAVHRTETHLIASRRIIENLEDLKTGTRRIKAWP